MVPDGRTEGRSQNYIPQTSSGDKNNSPGFCLFGLLVKNLVNSNGNVKMAS